MNNKNPSHLRLLLVSGAVKSARKRETMRLFQSNAVNCTSEPELSCLQCWWWWWWWRRWLIPRWCDEWVSELVCVCVAQPRWPVAFQCSSAVSSFPPLSFCFFYSTLPANSNSSSPSPAPSHLSTFLANQCACSPISLLLFLFFLFHSTFFSFPLSLSLPLPEWVSASPKSNRVHLEPFIGPGVFFVSWQNLA